jgi:hypothetical protein
MKWGVRRYQNKDGSLTSQGKKRYSKLTTADIDGKIQRDRDTAKIFGLGAAAAYGVSILGTAVSLLTGSPSVMVGATYVSSLIQSGTTVGSIAKYAYDGHKYTHKYD